jgi:hypothetical protein
LNGLGRAGMIIVSTVYNNGFKGAKKQLLKVTLEFLES